MPFEIIQGDITKLRVDAIVNAANSSLLGGGGVDGAIHQAAGPNLLLECKTLAGCKTGQAKITRGYNLPAKYVIHTVGPVWCGGTNDESKLLADCYKNALLLAKENNLTSIAFPLISTGAYRYPKDKALKIAIAVIGEFISSEDMMAYLVVYDKSSFMLPEELTLSIKEYINEKYTKEPKRMFTGLREKTKYMVQELDCISDSNMELIDVVNQLDETFSQGLLCLIDEKGMTDADTYKKANVDRRLFSKVRNDKYYKPRKSTAIAFAIALKLNIDETNNLLKKAGFTLSRSSKFDVIIEYFIENENYNIFEINEALFAFEQELLGV